MQSSDSIPPAPLTTQGPSGRSRVFLAVAVVSTLVIVILLAAYPCMFPKPQPLGDGPLITTLGTRINQTSEGNWTIFITSGGRGYKASNVRMIVTNRTTGEETVNKVVSKLAPARNDPDAIYNDSNSNSKLDAGDTIVLMASGGHVVAGYMVRFFQGQEIIGTIKELPP